MAELEIVSFNGVNALEAPQGADTYVAKKAVNFEQAIVVVSVNGRNITDDGTKLDLITVTVPVNLDDLNTAVGGMSAIVVLKGDWDVSTGVFPTAALSGESWIISVEGTLDGIEFKVGDRILAIVDTPSTVQYVNNWLKLDYTDRISRVNGKVGDVTLVIEDIAGYDQYLNQIDINTLAKLNALVTDATLTDVGDQATAAEGLLATTALQAESLDSLDKLNVLVVDATLIDTTDARLSDARNPLAHTHVKPVLDTLTAFAGGGQASAIQLAIGINVLRIVASDGDSAKLPPASAGIAVTVANKGVSFADLYPTIDDSIGDNAVNVSVPIPPNGTITLEAIDAINWIVI